MYNAGFKNWEAARIGKTVRPKVAEIRAGNTVLIENGWRPSMKGKVIKILSGGWDVEIEYDYCDGVEGIDKTTKKRDVFNINHLKKVYGRNNAYTD